MDEENTNMPDMEEPEAQEENQEPVDVDTGSGEEESSGGGSSVNPGTSASVGTGGSSEQIADNVMNQGKNLAENAKGKFMRGQNWVSNKLKQRKENLKDQAKDQAKKQLKKKLKGKVAGESWKSRRKKSWARNFKGNYGKSSRKDYPFSYFNFCHYCCGTILYGSG